MGLRTSYGRPTLYVSGQLAPFGYHSKAADTNRIGLAAGPTDSWQLGQPTDGSWAYWQLASIAGYLVPSHVLVRTVPGTRYSNIPHLVVRLTSRALPGIP